MRDSNRRQLLAQGGLFLGSATLALAPRAVRAEGQKEPLRAGAAKRRVTPPFWVPYLTSSGQGTSAPFRGLHDDLYARALVFDDGHQAAAILAVDSIGYDNAILGPTRDFTGMLRTRIAAATKLSAAAVMLSATHAHSTPETIGLTACSEGPGVRQWFEEHLQALADTVVEAWSKRIPARVYEGSVSVPGIARNRRIVLRDGTVNRHGPLPSQEQVREPWALDEDLAVLYLETDKAAPHALLLNYTAHPVVTMLLPEVSADYPGAAATLVEEALPGAICLFTQGAAGNVNTVRVSTSHQDAQGIGRRLGLAALDHVRRLKHQAPLQTTAVRVCSERVRLSPRTSAPLKPSAPKAKGESHGRRPAELRLAQKLAEGPIWAEVQAMGVGPVQWVSLPGEPFVETGLALKKAGAAFVIGYANGYVGYLPLRRAYAAGGYEVMLGPWSRVAPGSAEQLEAVGVKLLKRLAAGAVPRI
jgi:hypothetical protein